MPLQTWKCLVCEKKFSVGEWICQDGQSNHVVASKEYLLADAPTDTGRPERGGMDSLRDGRTRICNIPPDKQAVVNGELRGIPGGYVEFIRGRYSSDNPEIQYCLDKKGGFCTQERWESVWLSQSQQLELKEMSLHAREQRLENERNELLSQVKKQKEQPATAR
jgi:hypothetical protein